MAALDEYPKRSGQRSALGAPFRQTNVRFGRIELHCILIIVPHEILPPQSVTPTD